ncbi:alpha/beta hydrolase [Altererythrobacter arenosus]|uniref:Alpha/beta hydrolase n=1 Tax=Altererythrobacter arenosus TaxID=3032592 RepID=A0ABY8FRF6_9SPHN|nr:alpha/beta hydrolase [Altererythrobacter sp. CAU 1644]WFL77592.1 alpha/beta hydrolase [Altererythrobacter sp. CAU 1644]
MPEMRQIDTGEVSLRCAIEGEGPLVIFVHGFPESWYSWRHQLGPVAEAGFTACAIDVRGYGGSDKPPEIADYSLEKLAGDLVGLRQALQPDTPAILVGHDWGAPIVWNTTLTHPEHFLAVCGMSVPFAGAPQRPFNEIYHEHFISQGKFFYQEYFQEPGVAEAEAEVDPRDFVQRMMYSISGDVPPGDYWSKPYGATFLEGLPDPQPVPWLTDEDMDYYEQEFRQSGFRGPLNRYRNHQRDFEWLQAWRGQRIEQPALFIGGTRDPATYLFGAVTDPVAMMKLFAPRVEGHILDGVGHWTQQERPDEVNRLLIDWLKRL